MIYDPQPQLVDAASILPVASSTANPRTPELVVATFNQGKLAEIRALLARYPVRVTSLAAFKVSPTVENGQSYRENAIAKAVSAARASGVPALSDDSGIEVDALGGQPGLFTARWTKQQGGDEPALRALWRKLCAAGPRPPSATGASVFCALSLGWPDGRCLVTEARLDGNVIWPPRGSGRGLYGMFVPEGQHLSLAEIMQVELEDPDSVHQASHRMLAFLQLLDLGLAELLTRGRLIEGSPEADGAA
jgi:XTP/dITP diphosphohydrolase